MITYKEHFLIKNDCFRAGKKIKVEGLMLHSTGANNTRLNRYIQPDDGILGDNPNNNDWNRSGIEKCVHAFIGKDKKGRIKVYQTLPWNHRGWHAGGSANNTHIGVEICEDDLTHADYFEMVYGVAVDLFVHLCKKFGLTSKDIIDHSEGKKLGIASNHGDVMHWFPKYGKSMDTFRADVQAKLDAGEVTVYFGDKPEVKPGSPTSPTVGNASATIDVKPSVTVKIESKAKTIDQLATEVLRGVHGSGRERMISLGSNYAKVQQEVNRRLRG